MTRAMALSSWRQLPQSDFGTLQTTLTLNRPTCHSMSSIIALIFHLDIGAKAMVEGAGNTGSDVNSALERKK